MTKARPIKRTLNSPLSDAEICRRNGWRKGTVIEGDEGNGPERIKITAVGLDRVLAVGPGEEDEWDWSLTERNWRKVGGRA